MPVGPYILGFDLGTSAAMSAASGFWPESGKLTSLACYPELPDLQSRGLEDGVKNLYLDCHRRQELIVAGRRVSDISALAREAQDRWGHPAAIVCDSWREAELRDVLEDLHFPPCDFIIRVNGHTDGAEDVRDFRRAILGGQVTPDPSLLLTTAMREARVKGNDSGQFKMAKGTQGGRRANARDDAASAAVLAVAEGHRRLRAPASSMLSHVVV